MEDTLVVAVVEARDGKKAVDELVRLGFTATAIRLRAKFLNVGESIVLVGCQNSAKSEVEEIISDVCRARSVPYIPSFTDPIMEIPVVQDVEKGGGMIITLPIELSFELPGKGSTAELSRLLKSGRQCRS